MPDPQPDIARLTLPALPKTAAVVDGDGNEITHIAPASLTAKGPQSSFLSGEAEVRVSKAPYTAQIKHGGNIYHVAFIETAPRDLEMTDESGTVLARGFAIDDRVGVTDPGGQTLLSAVNAAALETIAGARRKAWIIAAAGAFAAILPQS